MSPASLRMSMGMRRRWAAKVVFIIGMYWWARSPDTEITRIRDCSPLRVSCAEASASVVSGLRVLSVAGPA